MRPAPLFLFAAALFGFSGATWAADGPRNLPTDHFALTWTALPTGRFVPDGMPSMPVRIARVHAAAPEDLDTAVLAASFASPQDPRERRDIAISEMAAGWDQTQRTALEMVREAQQAYAAADPVTAGSTGDESYVSLLSRIATGTGLSVAVDRSGDDDQALAAAYDASVKGLDPAARDKADAAQQAWLAYRAAFAALADLRAPGRADAVKAELTHRRIADLGARPQ